METIASKLNKRIKETGVKKNWVAERAGISSSTLRDILTGNRKPRRATLKMLCLVLGIDDVEIGVKKEAS